MECYDEEYIKKDKQVCLHNFLSNRKAPYFFQVQRSNGMY